jgi:hypothetical protein
MAFSDLLGSINWLFGIGWRCILVTLGDVVKRSMDDLADELTDTNKQTFQRHA